MYRKIFLVSNDIFFKSIQSFFSDIIPINDKNLYNIALHIIICQYGKVDCRFRIDSFKTGGIVTPLFYVNAYYRIFSSVAKPLRTERM